MGATLNDGNQWRGESLPFKSQVNRLTSMTDSNSNVLVSMNYDALGNLTRFASTNSIFDYYYDSLNRATQAICILSGSADKGNEQWSGSVAELV